MPNALLMRKLQYQLSAQRVREIIAEDEALASRLAEQLGQPGELVDTFGTIVELTEEERRYLESIPPVVQESIRAAALQGWLDSKDVFFHYAPGYEFEARVMEYGEGVSIVLLGPYPPYPRDHLRPTAS
jgi:hypothetical protein